MTAQNHGGSEGSDKIHKHLVDCRAVHRSKHARVRREASSWSDGAQPSEVEGYESHTNFSCLNG